MTTISNEQIEKLLADVSTMKVAINRNKPLLQLVVLPRHYRILIYLGSATIFALSLAAYALMAYYETFSAVPDGIRNIFYLLIAVFCALLAFLKYYKVDKSLDGINKKYTLSRIMLEFFSFRIVHVYLPVMSTMIVLIIYFSIFGNAYYIVPTISIGFGLFYNFIGSVTEIKQYLVSGYWMFFTGLLAVVYTGIAVPILLAGSIGIGLLLLALPMKED